MAKAPDFQQIMQEYNVKPYVAEPIINKAPGLRAGAELGAIADIGGTIIRGVQAYDKAKTLEGVTQQVNDIVNEQQQRSLGGVASLEKDVMGTQAQMEQVKKMAGYDETYPIMLNQQLKMLGNGVVPQQAYYALELLHKESRWNYKAKNPKSSAFGLFQMIGNKEQDPIKQIDKGLKYIEHRYGTACKALAHHKIKGWY